MIEPPPEYAACSALNHDPGDEDAGEREARHLVACDRQQWKCDTLMERHWQPLPSPVVLNYLGAALSTEPGIPWFGPARGVR